MIADTFTVKILIRIFLLLAVIAAVVFVATNQLKPEAVVVPVSRGMALDAVPGSVRVYASTETEVKAELTGRVTAAITVPNSGPVPVAKGDIIVQLDTETIELDIERAKIQLDAAQKRLASGSAFDASIEDAKAALEVNEALRANNQYPEAELEKERRALASLELQRAHETIEREEAIALMKNDIARMENNIDRLTLRSPIDGEVVAVYVPVGDLVFGGQVVARVISDERIVEVQLSEEDFVRISEGQHATVRLLSQGYTLFDGKVDTILAEADPITRRRAVYLDLNAPTEVLTPGTTGQATITRDQRKDTLIIPRRALIGQSLYVVEDGIVRERIVETGFMGIDIAEIVSGLEEGEAVIVETPHIFREGDRVKIAAPEG